MHPNYGLCYPYWNLHPSTIYQRHYNYGFDNSECQGHKNISPIVMQQQQQSPLW